MIKAIVFDFGNVLATFDNNKFLRKISPFTPYSVTQLKKKIYEDSNICKKYESRKIDSDEFFATITRLVDLDMPREEFKIAYADIFTPIPGMIDLAKTLKKKGYMIGLLSNTSYWDFNYGFLPIEDFKEYDSVSLSYQVGMMKPGEQIYQDTKEKLNLEFGEILYIDDIKEYAEVASTLGMKSIHFQSFESLVNKLKEMDIKF